MKLELTARRHVSLALRIAISSATFGLVVAGGAMLVGFWTLSQQLDERAAMEMRGRKELLVHILSTVPSRESVQDAKERFSEIFFGHDDLHLALVDPATGQVLAAFSDVASRSITAIGHATSAPDTMHSWRESSGSKFSGTHGLAQVEDASEVTFYLSVDRYRDGALLTGFVKATALALPLLLLIVAVGSGLIARTGLAPLHRFNKLAAAVGTQSLSERISLVGLPGELEDLAMEFNSMLKRLDEGYRRLEDFSGDLAHEMRTPVATLLGRTQVALSQTRTAAELHGVLEGNVEELDRLTALISDMLFIARADHQVTPLELEPVDLSREAERVAGYMSLVTDEKDLKMQVTGTAPALLADRLLVQRAITNLASNAIRHAAEHSIISLHIASTEQCATLAVANEGEVIPPEHIEHIFERFYRVDQGRARRHGGSGLGLAIVKSIVTLHAGSVSVRSHDGRTTFTLAFPITAVRQARTNAALIPA